MQAEVCAASAGRLFLAGPGRFCVRRGSAQRCCARWETAGARAKTWWGVCWQMLLEGGAGLGCQATLNRVPIAAKGRSRALLLHKDLQVARPSLPRPASRVVLLLCRRALVVAEEHATECHPGEFCFVFTVSCACLVS